MMNDEWRINEERWKMKVVWWKMKDLSCWGVLLPDGRTNEQTDICECRVAFATEKYALWTPFHCTLVNVFNTSLWKFENGTKIKWFCRGSIYDFWMIYLLFMFVTIDNLNHKSHSLKFHVIWISSWH